MAVVIDCDLYQSYMDTFKFCWPKLSLGGMIHIDEYYSIKFPGGRQATDQFFSDKRSGPVMAIQKLGDFERWHIVKNTKLLFPRGSIEIK